jgi:hypothetical protein
VRRQQPGRRGGRDGQHHGVGLDEQGLGRRAADQPPAGGGSLERAGGGAKPDVRAAGGCHRGRQPAHPTLQAGEHRPTSIGRQGGARRGDERALPAYLLQQRRRGHRQGQSAGVARVDAAEQRLDEPVDHHCAESAFDQLPDGDVLGRSEQGTPRP